MAKRKTLIQVERISTTQKAALEARGFEVMISNTVDKMCKTLHAAAAQALKRGNVEQAKRMRLNMLRLIKTKRES